MFFSARAPLTKQSVHSEVVFRHNEYTDRFFHATVATIVATVAALLQHMLKHTIEIHLRPS